jgi:uncharacterized DUF497 family protein
MNYVWDRRKGRANLTRHGIAFEDAIGIFDGPTLEKVDNRFDYSETRVYAIGVANGLEVTVIYTRFRVRTPNHFGMEGRTA